MNAIKINDKDINNTLIEHSKKQLEAQDIVNEYEIAVKSSTDELTNATKQLEEATKLAEIEIGGNNDKKDLTEEQIQQIKQITEEIKKLVSN